MVSPYKSRNEFQRLIRAAVNSLAGLRVAFREERAFRLEMWLALVLIALAAVLSVPPTHRALLIASVLLVLIVELLNSALEAAVDRISLEQHPLAGRAKDMASAAVLLSLVNAGVVWTLVLIDV